MDDVINHENTEYYSHVLAEFVDGEYENDWILVTIYNISKWWYHLDREGNISEEGS